MPDFWNINSTRWNIDSHRFFLGTYKWGRFSFKNEIPKFWQPIIDRFNRYEKKVLGMYKTSQATLDPPWSYGTFTSGGPLRSCSIHQFKKPHQSTPLACGENLTPPKKQHLWVFWHCRKRKRCSGAIKNGHCIQKRPGRWWVFQPWMESKEAVGLMTIWATKKTLLLSILLEF